jgi:ElaB/YqjD/DUF883 family membrane-anchored ribosome-binding protein
MQKRDRDIVDNSPMAAGSPQADDLTQQSGYTPATEMQTELSRPERGTMQGQQGTQQKVKETASKAQDKASEMGQKAQETASKAGEKAQEKVDQGMDSAAGGMESAASKLREQAENMDGMPAQAGTKVADTMERTAGYLREHDSAEIMDDIEQYVREHPMQAVAGAIVGGFLIGRILS